MKNKDVSLKQAVFALERADNILILCHKNPDGDAWGSAFALYAALIKIGKRARVGGLSGLPPLYNYMGDFCRSHDGDFAEQFVVSVDCSNYERLIEMPAEPVDLAFDHWITVSVCLNRTVGVTLIVIDLGFEYVQGQHQVSFRTSIRR